MFHHINEKNLNVKHITEYFRGLRFPTLQPSFLYIVTTIFALVSTVHILHTCPSRVAHALVDRAIKAAVTVFPCPNCSACALARGSKTSGAHSFAKVTEGRLQFKTDKNGKDFFILCSLYDKNRSTVLYLCVFVRQCSDLSQSLDAATKSGQNNVFLYVIRLSGEVPLLHHRSVL